MINKILERVKILYHAKRTHSRIYSLRRLSNVSFSQNNIIYENCELRDCELGRFSYIGGNCRCIKTKVGSFCSIGANCRIIIGEHPTERMVSTHPIFYSKTEEYGLSITQEQKFEEYRYADAEKKWHVIIGNDVWIGDNVLILEGVRIGNGAVIAAGAVVTKDIPDYAVAAGVPAQVKKYRFSEEEIAFLNKIRWWDREIDWLRKHGDRFSSVSELMRSIQDTEGRKP